jgi:amidase
MEIFELDALDLSAALATRQISAVEVMQATLARIAVWNGSVNAIVSMRDADALLAAAAAADAGPAQGWLHGIPVAIKETGNAKGFATSKGSPVLAGQMAERDDIAVSRLRAAGAIFIGKTNVPEFGLGSHSVNPVFGATCNPYDLTRSAGGSSGGAGVSLATGMTCVADGSDIMGSLRNPAGWNNVYGMRPSWGLVPSEPRGETFLQHLATNGPMARSPRDLAGLLDTMAGPDPRQPGGFAQAPSLPQIRGDATGLRIGWLDDWGGTLVMEPGVIDLCEDALRRMEGQGQHIEPLSPPFDREAMWQAWNTLRSFLLAGHISPFYTDTAKRAQLNANVQWEVAQGLALSAMDVHRASVIRSDWFATAAALFDTYDVLALPSAQMWPFDVTLDWPRTLNGITMDTYHRWMEVVVPASLIGLPAISVPAGFGGPDDLPMGLQLIGRRGSDALLLDLAERWHQATDWPRLRPPKVPS